MPFRSSLFEAATQALRIQPIAVGYRRADGSRLSDDETRSVGWADEQSFASSIAQTARRALSAEIRVTPAFAPQLEMTRKQLAERCRIAVAEAYAAIRN